MYTKPRRDAPSFIRSPTRDRRRSSSPSPRALSYVVTANKIIIILISKTRKNIKNIPRKLLSVNDTLYYFPIFQYISPPTRFLKIASHSSKIRSTIFLIIEANIARKLQRRSSPRRDEGEGRGKKYYIRSFIRRNFSRSSLVHVIFFYHGTV